MLFIQAKCGAAYCYARGRTGYEEEINKRIETIKQTKLGVGLQGAMASGMYSGAAAGFINGAGHAWANGGSWQDVLMGGITGAITGGVTGAFAAGALFGVNKLASSGANSIFKDIPCCDFLDPYTPEVIIPPYVGFYDYAAGAFSGSFFIPIHFMGQHSHQFIQPMRW